jgi:hypothetical protein
MSLLYGVHDRQGRRILPPGGWCLDTMSLSDNAAPTDYAALRADINWLVRVNWGYGSTGTIPLPKDDNLFMERLAHYVHNSRGVHAWIIGNEPNHEQERPDGVQITPERYAYFFVRARNVIKSTDSQARVIPAAIAPYHASPVPWTDYLREVLDHIAASGGCDGINVHAYTRSSDPDDITSEAMMGPPLQGTYSGFYTYLDAIEAIPWSIGHQPVYITEFNELLPNGWDDRNTGVVQAAYADINQCNQSNADGNAYPILCLILYRWPQFDKWHIEGKVNVLDDFHAAMQRGYQSPAVSGATNNVHQTFIPAAPNESPAVAAPELPSREWDERLTARGIELTEYKPQAGETYMRLVKGEYWEEKEHTFAVTLGKDGQRLPGITMRFWWGNGNHDQEQRKATELKPHDRWMVDFPMFEAGHSYGLEALGYPSDSVFGMGLGSVEQPDWNIHVSYHFTFQLVTMPAATHPAPPPVVPEPPTEPTEPTASRIIEPRVAQAILQIESGGRSHGDDGRVIIRFEAHIFKTHLSNDALWAQHFRTDGQRVWVDQMWRRSPGEPWRHIHTGKQADEWAVFEFATQFNAEAAAKSISVGSAQIMGFHHARIGYGSATAMLRAFDRAPMQTVGFVNFCLSDPALMAAMHRKDWREVARRYNGAGNVDHYAALLQQAYAALA